MADILDILKQTGAIIADSHFVLTSGKHAPLYINKDALYPHTDMVSEVGKLFAEKFKDTDIDVVVAPALGGIILSQWTASHLSKLKGKEILGIYTEKDPESNQIFKRGYDLLVKDKNVLIIEDLTSTGGSVKKVVNTVRGAGGNIVAVCVMVNKNPGEVNEAFIGAPFSSLAELPTEIYDSADCPLCKSGVPVNALVGHGKKFLEEKKAAGA